MDVEKLHLSVCCLGLIKPSEGRCLIDNKNLKSKKEITY